jgi:DNA-binding transcriptional regulator YiaG
MTFQESISEISAPELVRILGCPRATAYQWKDGRRQPPAWLQPILLAVIVAAQKRHNKTSHGTTQKRSKD